jgi:isoquinoline 1-oxidoreductase subunit alpha
VPTFVLLVNGARREVEIDASETLLSVLRDDLDLTGTKYGCGEGQCGACTVLVDGEPTRACLTKASELRGKPVTTIEGIEAEGSLHPVQAAFLEVDAMQCGYCTPGMIVEGVALLRRQADPSDEQIASAMERHVCRCCTYPRIVRAVRQAAKTARNKPSAKGAR